MAFKISEKVKIITNNNEMYIGTLRHICLGINEKEYPTKASVILEDNVLPQQSYGNVHIWCDEIKNIQRYFE